MTEHSEPFSRIEGGGYVIGLTEHERSLLRDLPGQLISQIESGVDDGSTFRLFPPGYSDDLGRQVEYDRLMRDDLQNRHMEALRLLQSTAEREQLSEVEMDGWVRAINQLRLVLGTRLDVSEEEPDEAFDPADPAAGAYALYEYLGYLLTCAVEAASGSLPPSS